MILSLPIVVAGQAPADSPQEQHSLPDQLLDAAHNGDTAAVEQMLAKGVGIDARGKDGLTALIAASAIGKIDIMKLLLGKGASIDLRDDRGDTALHYAVMVSNVEEVKLLLDKGASVDVQ
jgi:ankyrin repeat protein